MNKLEISQSDQVTLIKTLLSMPHTYDLNTHSSLCKEILVSITAFNGTELNDLYLYSIIHKCDAETWLKKLAHTRIVNGDQSERIDYDDMNTDEIFDALKSVDFISLVEDWELRMS